MHERSYVTSPASTAYLMDAFYLQRTLEKRVASLPYEHFDDLLHPTFQAEEWCLVLLGAVFGAAFGFLQVAVLQGGGA